MGFFKKVKKALGGSGTGALLGGLLVGGVPGIVGGALLGESLLGGEADEQAEALRRAGKTEEAALLQARQFQARVEAAGAPFREAATGALGQLQQRAAAPIGTSRAFQQQLQSGLAAQQAGLARFGLGESSVAGVGASQLTSRLLTQDEATRLSIQQSLASGGLAGFGQSLGGMQVGAGLSGRLAQTQANIGAAQEAGRRADLQTGINIAGLFVGGK